MDSPTIRIWNGCKVLAVFTISPDGVVKMGESSGASSRNKIDIELDPWAGLITDYRVPRFRVISTSEGQ